LSVLAEAVRIIQPFLGAPTMAIPDYQTLMLPLLKIAGDRQEHRVQDVIPKLAQEFSLNDDERAHLLPSGKQRAIAESW
jgi:restriction system protein